MKKNTQMKCIICESEDFLLISDHVRNKIPKKVVMCNKCKLVSLENPEISGMNYTNEEYRKSHSPVIGKELSPMELYNMQISVQNDRIERISPLLNEDFVVLEIGSSTGHTLQSIKKKVKNSVGIELDPRHAKFSREQFDLKIFEEPLGKADLPYEKFDIIFMFQVFEHIPNPIEFLNLCKNYLKNDGILYLEIPNIDDALLSIYNISSFKEFYFRLPHPYYYSAKTLGKILEKAGFVGEIKGIQEYSVFNHINWLLTKKPQADQKTGYKNIEWEFDNSGMKNKNKILKDWFEKTNKEYKKMLEKNYLTEHLSFKGKIKL